MEKLDWNTLFSQALTQPGVMSKAYSVFYEYSLGNAFLAAVQLFSRNIPLGPWSHGQEGTESDCVGDARNGQI